MQRKRTSRSALSAEHAVLGGALRQLRARHAISQEELGHRAGLHRNYVGALERGEINPTFRTLMTITTGLEIPLSELMRLYEQRRTQAV